MTTEEAINIIEDVTWQDNGRHYEKIATAREIAISAIEKQIPKKVKDKYRDIVSIGKCPVCERQCDTTMNYCMKCGQALYWSDTE